MTKSVAEIQSVADIDGDSIAPVTTVQDFPQVHNTHIEHLLTESRQSPGILKPQGHSNWTGGGGVQSPLIGRYMWDS